MKHKIGKVLNCGVSGEQIKVLNMSDREAANDTAMLAINSCMACRQTRALQGVTMMALGGDTHVSVSTSGVSRLLYGLIGDKDVCSQRGDAGS